MQKLSVPQEVCVRCVMDVTDPDITFDAEGVCNHCCAFEANATPVLMRAQGPEGRAALEKLVAEMKTAGQGRDYDCVIGISGGVDSSYVAWKVKELGLRPLAVHFDSGWNSELAVNNIENIVKRLNLDLHTFVVDWEEMADLQLAFFKAGLSNCDIPTDHGFLAVLYRIASQHRIRHFVSGGNLATEGILPPSWGYNASDLRHLRSVHKSFGRRTLSNYPQLPFAMRYFWYPVVRGIKEVRLLNFIPYNKVEAKELIEKELRWRDYGGKHYESIFTRFFQAYYLPMKFGIDKRKAHLSSLVVSGQMTREEALAELNKPTAPRDMLERDKAFIAKKMNVSESEFDTIIAGPKRSFADYPSNAKLFNVKTKIQEAVGFRPRSRGA